MEERSSLAKRMIKACLHCCKPTSNPRFLNYIHVFALIPLWPPYSSEHASFVQMHWKTSFPDLPLTTKVAVLSVFTLPLVLINLG